MILLSNKHKIPFQVDEEDYEVVSNYVWCVRQGYVSRNNRDGKTTHLHTFLLGKAPEGLVWDHENRDKLDNRRDNLRAVTESVNVQNTGLRSTNLSGTKGISLRPNGWWQVRITVNKERLVLGCFPDLEEAVAVRQKAEQQYGL